MKTCTPVACSAAALMLALVFTSPVSAQSSDSGAVVQTMPWPRAYVQLGGFLTENESTFRLGLNNIGLGLNLNVEKFLGLDATNTAFRIEGAWRFSGGRRHAVLLSWFQVKRRGGTTLSEDITLPDSTVIPAGTGISSVFDFAIIKARYNYSIVYDHRVDVNLGIGVYVMPIKYGLGRANRDRTEESITAPLPVLAVGFNAALSPKWFLRQSVDVLYLEISGVKGAIFDLNLAVERQIYKSFALGFGIESLDISVDVEEGGDYPGLDFVGHVGFKYTGLQLYVRGQM